MTISDLLATIFISALTAAFVTLAVVAGMALANRIRWTPVPPPHPPASWLAKQGADQ